MVYLATFILFFTCLQLFVSFVNLVFRQKLSGIVKHQNQLVSVLIPARNEGQSIGCLLSDLLNQNYKHLEIWVFDDDSADDTAQIVTEFAQKDDRIKLLQSTKLPEGWLGKNFACHSLAQKAKGKWFLFLDADVRTSDQ
ncbi:MAG TPA: glycosyltransferase family A protein, partial [Prolixibacteraceae bacterium]|nr:glycosyltransferase family A protein [Prolixibacteraceae bacterium]